MTMIVTKEWDGKQTTEKLVHAEKTIDNGTPAEIKALAVALLVKYKNLTEDVKY